MTEGELIPLNDALNKPRTKFGLDHRLLLGTVMASVVVFLLCSKIYGSLLCPACIIFGKLITLQDEKWFDLWSKSFLQSSHYDPRSSR